MLTLHLPSPPIASLLGLGLPEIVLILVLCMGPIMVVAIVGFALYFKHRQRQQWHDLVRLALERGQPIPPLPGQRSAEAVASAMDADRSYRLAQHSRRRSDVTGGLVLLGIGAAIFLGLPPNSANRGFLIFAYVPAFIGIALVLSALFETVFARKRDEPGTQPPQP